ncbi:hypothetical protein ACFWOG_16310 [Kitasatospora sp. NPDC058406]|uniref:hypothetical protein n=1 Tax=Kitasatospora sp. NPDC058406 TaxID=3346483 RepID=UPI0036673E94
MIGPRRVLRSPDGDYPPPDGVGPDTVWFAEGTAADETWAVGYPGPDAETRAARAWAATARAVADAARAAGGRSTVLVPGDGALAGLVRLALPDAVPAGPEVPAVVVETTGTGAGILQALAAVRPGGCVLLAARPLHLTANLPTYRAIHRPGVRVLPTRWADATADTTDPLVSWALAHLTPDRPGQAVTPGAWYRLAARPPASAGSDGRVPGP